MSEESPEENDYGDGDFEVLRRGGGEREKQYGPRGLRKDLDDMVFANRLSYRIDPLNDGDTEDDKDSEKEGAEQTAETEVSDEATSPVAETKLTKEEEAQESAPTEQSTKELSEEEIEEASIQEEEEAQKQIDQQNEQQEKEDQKALEEQKNKSKYDNLKETDLTLASLEVMESLKEQVEFQDLETAIAISEEDVNEITGGEESIEDTEVIEEDLVNILVDNLSNELQLFMPANDTIGGSSGRQQLGIQSAAIITGNSSV